MKIENFNVGIIGFGRMGKIHDKILNEFPNVKVTKIYDPSVSIKNEARATNKVKEIVGDPEIDIVFIATPNNVTVPTALAAIKSKKHVFCEKPLGRTSKEAYLIYEALNKNKEIIFKVGFNHRYLAHYIKAKEIINSNIFGEIEWIIGRYGKGCDEEYLKSWRSKKDISGGGILIDQGIHMLDMITDLVGSKFNEIKSMCINSHLKQRGYEDNAFILMKTLNNQVVSLHSSLNQIKHLFSLDIGLSSGLIEIKGVLSSTKSYGQETLKVFSNWGDNSCNEQNYKFNNKDYYSFRNQTKDFLDCIHHFIQPTTGTVNEGIRALDLIEQIYDNSGIR